MLNNGLLKRLADLERKAATDRESIFFIVRYSSSEGLEREPIAYSRDSGPKVQRHADESPEEFFDRAKTELFGDEAKTPGIHVLYGWSDEEAGGERSKL